MTKVLPLHVGRAAAPAAPPHPTLAQVPAWQVLRFPAVGSDAVTIIGFDGDGFPLCKATVRLGSSVEMWERAAEIEVDAARREAELRPLPSLSFRRPS